MNIRYCYNTYCIISYKTRDEIILVLKVDIDIIWYIIRDYFGKFVFEKYKYSLPKLCVQNKVKYKISQCAVFLYLIYRYTYFLSQFSFFMLKKVFSR